MDIILPHTNIIKTNQCNYSANERLTFGLEMLFIQHYSLCFGLIAAGLVFCQQINMLRSQIQLQRKPKQSELTIKLKQLIELNNINLIQVIIEENSIDDCQQLIESISKIQRPLHIFQWQLWKIRQYVGHHRLPVYPGTRLMLANSQRKWFVYFADHLEFDREAHALCMAANIRNNNHLSLVIVLKNPVETYPNKQKIFDYLQYVWTHTHPTDLLAIVCAHSESHGECISYRYNPEMTIQMATNSTETLRIFAPADHSALLRLQRPSNVEPERFVAKFTVNFVTSFVAIDLAANAVERLVGFNVWTAQLLAEMLNKPLHLVLIGLAAVQSVVSDSKLQEIITLDMRPSTTWMVVADRINFTSTYAESMDEYNK